MTHAHAHAEGKPHRHRMRESKQTIIACGIFLLLLAGGLAAAAKWYPYDAAKAKAFQERGRAHNAASGGKHHDKPNHR